MARLIPALLLLLTLATQNAAPADPPRVGVWIDPALAPRAAVDPGALLESVEGAAPVATGDLASRKTLDPAKMPLLILPYADCYPAPGLETLHLYLRGGGACISFGPAREREPLFEKEQRWIPLSAPAGAFTPIPATLANCDLANHGDCPPLQASAPPGDAAASRFATDDLKSYLYATWKLHALPADAAILSFETRGAPATTLLCLEIREEDGSRWKQIVPITGNWTTHHLHTASFVSYATPRRADTPPQPARAKTISFGLFKGLVPPGSHAFEIRHLKVAPAAVPAPSALGSPLPLPGRALLDRHFSKFLPPRSSTRHWPEPFAAGPRFSGAILHPIPHPITDVTPAPAPRSDGAILSLDPPRDPGRETVLLFPGSTAAPRIVPLLAATDPRGQSLGPAALLALPHPDASRRNARLAGAWLSFGSDRLDLAPGTGMRELIARAARLLATRAMLAPALVTFPTRDGVAEIAFAVPAPRTTLPTTWAMTIAQGDAQPLTRQLAPVASDEPIQLHRAPLERFDWRAFQLRLESRDGSAPLDRVTVDVDLRGALRDLCDFLVAQGADDGKFSGTHYFVDHRGARTLLAAHEITGDRRYLDAAMAWGRVMMAEQRPDGGYRMGYGITSRGEACFVADGGEIALGIARLASRARPDERARLLESLRAYMRYREGFRCPGGGIGVGWCFHDFGKRPIAPLDVPTKIFAPDLNPYTIGCTLGAAYAYAELTGAPADLASARADADWYMARVERQLTGAAAESFVLAHALERDPTRRDRYARHLRERFAQPMADATNAWWLGGGGRAALDLHALVYCHHHLGQDPRLLTQIARAACAMFARESPTSIRHLLERPSRNHDEWIYLCFGGIGLADAIAPLASLRDIARPQP